MRTRHHNSRLSKNSQTRIIKFEPQTRDIQEWRSIGPYFRMDYEVSSDGIVRNRNGVVNQYLDTRHKWNHPFTVIHRADGKSITQKVHSLVLNVFVGPKPSAYYECGHLNGCASDNRAENLRWITRSENNATRKIKHSENHPFAKMSNKTAKFVYALRKQGMTYKQIATQLHLTFEQVRGVCSGRTWRNLHPNKQEKSFGQKDFSPVAI